MSILPYLELSLAALFAALFALRQARGGRVLPAESRRAAAQAPREVHARTSRDALTGLWNRAAILDILAREIEAARAHAVPLAVAIIDIDHFRRLNETRGSRAGDEVLRTLGRQLATRVRSADSLGRCDGEEFLLLLPGAPPQAPFLPLERLKRAIPVIPVSFDGTTVKVTASVGVAWLQLATDTPETLVNRARATLHSAQSAGRNRIEYAAAG